MTRKAFKPIAAVGLGNLLLDTKNPRIRSGHDQEDCVERLLRKPKQMLALAKDIAANGLSTAPILVEPVKGNKFVVWDGNRRVTALKLLNKPAECRNRALATQFSAIAAKASVPIPKAIDVLASTDKLALLKEVLARHAGAMEGAGQLTWDALLRTMFLLGHKAPADYRIAGMVLMWAEENGIEVDDTFPITTIHRFLNKRNLARLGFSETGDSVAPNIDVDEAIRLIERMVQDFGPAGNIGVNEVFEQSQQDSYIESLLDSLGLRPSKGIAGEHCLPSDKPHANGDKANAGAEVQPKRPRSAGNRSNKPDYDRRSVVRIRFKPTFEDHMWKAEEVLKELRRLETKSFPIAAAALFRCFFELSTRSYMKRHKVSDGGQMHKNALAVAEHMRRHGRIDQGELDAANRRLKDKSQSEALLQYNTLNDYMHSFKHLPDRQSLHVLWTELEAYLEACWDDARRPS